MEAIEATTIGNKLRAFLFEHLPHHVIGTLRMRMRLGVSDALVEQPGVQLVVALYSQPWREEALAHQANLVLHLTFLPAGSWWAGDRIHQVMCAHLQKAAVVLPVLANKHRLHRGLHVVVD